VTASNSQFPLTTVSIQASLETKAVPPEVKAPAVALRFSQHVKGNKLDLSLRDLQKKDIDDVIAVLKSNPEIDEVDLSNNRLGPEGAKYFAQKNTTAKTVDLHGNAIGAQGAKDFAKYNKVTTMANLCGNAIGAKGALWFARKNKVATTVLLNNNDIGPQGARGFARRNKIATTVSLSDNGLGAKGAIWFAENNKVAQTVYLSRNNLQPAGAEGFARANQYARKVDLSSNFISDRGAEGFARENKYALTVDLSSNFISDRGAEGFARENKYASNVDLSINEIRDRGAQCFIGNPLYLAIDLSYNLHISAGVLANLKASVAKSPQYYGWAEVSLMIAMLRANQGDLNLRGYTELVPTIFKYMGASVAPTKKGLFDINDKSTLDKINSALFFRKLAAERNFHPLEQKLELPQPSPSPLVIRSNP